MERAWEQPCRDGIAAFRSGEFEKALSLFNAAISSGGQIYNIYDSRAATFEKLGRFKEALDDSRRVIDLAPQQRHGYIRSARLFLLAKKFDAATEMAGLALSRIPPQQTARRLEVEHLQAKIRSTAVQEVKFPFSKLPVELVSLIFTSALMGDAAFPVNASRVCQDWRKFVVSRPEYWQTLILSGKSPVKKLGIWIERSKGQIVVLQIREDVSDLQLHDMLEIFHENPDVFKTLKKFHAETDVLKLLDGMAIVPSILSNLHLEELFLYHISWESYAYARDLVPFIIEPLTSKMHVLNLHNFYIDWRSISQLTCLESLVIDPLPMQAYLPELWHILASNLMLRKILFSGSSLTRMPASPSVFHRITLPYLCDLTLTGESYWHTLTEQLSLPSLEQITVAFSSSPADAILKAVQPTPTSLREVHLFSCSFDIHSLTKYLVCCHALTNLSITSSSADVNILVEALATTQETDAGRIISVPCPQLRAVNFTNCLALMGEPIVRLIKSRLQSRIDNNPPAIIDEINIDSCPRIDPSVLPWLKTRVSRVMVGITVSRKRLSG